MSDERRDDEIIGRALSRAIETIDVNETPFERSRVANVPLRRGWFNVWNAAGVAATLVAVVAVGAYLLSPKDQPGVVGASPTSSPVPSSSASSSATPTSTPVATVAPGQLDHFRVYFARDGLPPTSAHVDNAGVGQTPADRIASRLKALQTATPPPGATNAFPANSSISVQNVAVSGDLVTIDYSVPNDDWRVRGAAASDALIAQLVYTASEEPGIRRVLVTQNGGHDARIDQLGWGRAHTREDVNGYAIFDVTGASHAIAQDGNSSIRYQVAVTSSVDSVAPALARVVLTFKDAQGADLTELPGFEATLDASQDTVAPGDGKYALTVKLHTGQQWVAVSGGDAVVDRTPLRAVRLDAAGLRIALDDVRPWRLFTLANPARIVVDIGGDPRATSDRIALTAPEPGDVANAGADLTVTGSARVFEANVVWRILDSTGKLVANGHFLTSLGSSAVWGTFNTKIPMPANERGKLTLELYEASPKDGTAQGLVQIPLAVR
jgi:Immunoglobulin-like domain of bacterial spore germination/Sporulation and spore germination